MKTYVRGNGPGYVLNGHKTFITNGPCADTILVYAKLDEGDGVPTRESRSLWGQEIGRFQLIQLKLAKMEVAGINRVEQLARDAKSLMIYARQQRDPGDPYRQGPAETMRLVARVATPIRSPDGEGIS